MKRLERGTFRWPAPEAKSMEWTAAELAALRDAFTKVYAIKDDRGFQHHAGIHGYPLPVYCQHGTPL